MIADEQRTGRWLMKDARTFEIIKVIGLDFQARAGEIQRVRGLERERERDGERDREREEKNKTRQRRDIEQRNTLTNSQSQLLQ